jgi:hypothetical protein
MEVLFMFKQGLNTLGTGKNAMFFYNVGKEEETERLNFEGLDMFFKTLDKLGKKAFGHAIIMFDGYNDTAIELYEIPEVRAFVKELFKRYPHVLNYINFDLEGHKHLMTSLFDVEVMYQGERLTFAEHEKRYGYFTPMPRYDAYISMPDKEIQRIKSAMLQHGSRLNSLKRANEQFQRFSRHMH